MEIERKYRDTEGNPKTLNEMVRDEMDEIYVAVLKRAIPVEDCSTDTLTHIIKPNETVLDVMKWAERECVGQAVMVRLEIAKAE